MENHTYKLIEITGTSNKSIEDAIEQAVKKAANSVDELRWFKVIETRGSINEDHIQQWQVTVKIGFTLKD
ncbi:MAG TPA: dodecin [Halalkalibaculum sp.]|nr:dodecin [Halalkalibaculum sp.]